MVYMMQNQIKPHDHLMSSKSLSSLHFHGKVSFNELHEEPLTFTKISTVSLLQLIEFQHEQLKSAYLKESYGVVTYKQLEIQFLNFPQCHQV
jgi:hypothetical protein